MSPKAQHSLAYRRLPIFLRNMRQNAGFTQRVLGAKLGRPQSWIQNCETASRRVDITEFIRWARACGLEPMDAFKQFLEAD